ncbi:MAG: pyrroline-5-carboxylate reductase [Coriobacteriia bacterium]|nr:pyrroline-5-carboxylate reductase [Coriobacteriia bacterium]
MSLGHVRIDGTLAIIGGGRMGEAIAAGLISASTLDAAAIVVAEPIETRRTELTAAHGVRCVPGPAEAVRGADIVVLAVKPQVIDVVVNSIAAELTEALVISIAAGISCARLESHLPAGTAVVRVMPNTPALVRAGMTVVSGGSEATAEQVDLVRELFGSLGKVIVVDEDYQDIAAAISGSGPAYVALVVDALARAGVRHGLPRQVAEGLALQTVAGTAELIEVTGQHPEQVIDGVTSPGGTTIAAIEALEAAGLRAAFAAAVSAAVARAKELSS